VQYRVVQLDTINKFSGLLLANQLPYHGWPSLSPRKPEHS